MTTVVSDPPSTAPSDDEVRASDAAVSSAPGRPALAGRRRRFGLSIQSKLLMMLLGVSLISSIITGIIGYVSGRESLQAAAIDKLTTIRETRADEIEHQFEVLQRGVQLDSRNASAVEGMSAFIAGFEQLKSAKLTAAETSAMDTFYAEQFVPQLEQRSGLDYDASAFKPATPAGRYLQAKYTVGRPYDDFDAGLALSDASDGSAWSAANKRYGHYFAGLVETLEYEDILMIDRTGNVVYSAYKSVDLGVNLREEPYGGSIITNAFNALMRNGSLDEVITTDFERYLPSLNVPTAWVLSPVGTATNIIGAMAVQVPIDQINEAMTGAQRWEAQGLGKTGEVYLAGTDQLMRSVSRLLLENPEQYRTTVVENGTPADTAERIYQVKGTVQLQPVGFLGVQEALKGRTGTALAAEYTNAESLVAYAPLEISGLSWVIVAHMDQAEAFGPVNEFTRNLLLSLLAILLAISLLSLLLAQVFTRPIKMLVDAVRRVAGGDLTVQVPANSRDEFGDLGSAFNDMSSSLRIKQQLIDDQRAENEKLLHTLMPGSVVERYKSGEQAIAEQHDNVSVVYAELTGLDDYVRNLGSADEVTQLNTLMRGFDEAAERVGVEKVRALRGGYLASSGMVVPRVDNMRRAVEFAVQLRAVVERFNSQYGSKLDVRAGIDTGSVTSGLVARTNLAYDLWGDAVNLAYRARSVTGEPGIYVSQAVRERLGDTLPFSEAGTVELRGTKQTIWKVGQP